MEIFRRIFYLLTPFKIPYSSTKWRLVLEEKSMIKCKAIQCGYYFKIKYFNIYIKKPKS